ncbi:hypothetical protein THIOM_005279 [Candidatus Thiomargarita nelsonii]|uniref:ATPase AAA-type core domain-containing protein n=1 Tax=Candidatus Thiomargarita nelsonii TaxID=1003181 RepID=A0A176RTP9_9GAMM|nr:hypothetical protein THIOM_005279 [Candidatus Thiomargarita nelsonii]
MIEEIENGLEPRTIHLIVEEIRNVVESSKTQIIVTTHSPYFLDLLRLEHIFKLYIRNGLSRLLKSSQFLNRFKTGLYRLSRFFLLLYSRKKNIN